MLLRIASGEALPVDQLIGRLLAFLPHLSEVCEADTHGWVCDGVSGGAGKAAEAVLPCDVGIGNGNPLDHGPASIGG